VGIKPPRITPALIAAHGLTPEELSFEAEAIRQTVRGYTREAGVRSLEREIAAIARKVARRIAEGHREPVRITADRLTEYLGRPRFFDEVAERTTRPGVATGLAWTPVGGDVLFVEVTMMPSTEERLVLTGMLGEFRVDAEVVYCQRLGPDECAIGLKFDYAVVTERLLSDTGNYQVLKRN